MINRTKLSVIAVSAVLAVALTGCGGSASSAPSSVSSASVSAPVSDAASPAADTAENGTADLDSAVETLLAADPISNQFEIAAMNIEYDFGLKAEDVAAYKGVKSNDNGDAGLVLVVEAASGKAQDVVTALESYKQDQVAFYGNYAEFAQAQSNVENAIISSKGDRVVMVIASNGSVKSKVCRVSFSVTQEICRFFTSFANGRLAGRSLNEISAAYINSVAYSFGDYTEVFTTLLSAIYSLCKEMGDGQFCTKGVTNLLRYDEMKDFSRELVVMLDEKQSAIGLIPDGNFELKVTVGKENNSMELSNAAVVAVKYPIGHSRCGTLALIGPVRMEYPKLIPHMQYFAKMLSELLSETMEPHPGRQNPQEQTDI